jgi:L-malate glycosyltransferase
MQSAKALLLPSIIEGLPGVILEAMYCKTPVVAYNVGGIGEVLQHKVTGWLIPAGDEEAFVHSAYEAATTSHAEIIRKAHQLVVRQYNNRVIASRFLNIYSELIS